MSDNRPLRYKSVDYEEYLDLEIGQNIDLPAPDGKMYPYMVTGHDYRAKPKTQVEIYDPDGRISCKYE